jgi:NAD(P)-dependent dehydrogenase (short-subunit alcohol dehydrogenase family)
MSPIAIVTASDSGIGQETAKELAEKGYDVGITYHEDEVGAKETLAAVEEMNRRGEVRRLDLTNPALPKAADVIDELADALGGVDVLVNNAGVNRRATVLEETIEGFDRTLAVNLVGPWACAQAAARHMIDAGRGGRIVNVTSVLAFVALDGGGAYGAAKAGLELLTKVLALELAPHAIKVNAVAPGHTATPMNYGPDDLEAATIERPVIPAARAAAPDEIAAAIAFLASPAASYATGASLLVDGGLLLASGPQSLQDATGRPPEPAA